MSGESSMQEQIDKGAEKRWIKADNSFQNYYDYLGKKANKFELTFIDLLYIANFKGGNATIRGSEKTINDKLRSYSKKIIDIEYKFNSDKLAALNKRKLNKLVKLISKLLELTHKDKISKIDGFSVSYLSALLNAYFPELIPIIDRRVLYNLNILRKKKISIDYEKYYARLLRKVAAISQQKNKTIREIDKEYFIKKLKK
jgi:hypothetical protein